MTLVPEPVELVHAAQSAKWELNGQFPHCHFPSIFLAKNISFGSISSWNV